jgi:hypothetical protein
MAFWRKKVETIEPESPAFLGMMVSCRVSQETYEQLLQLADGVLPEGFSLEMRESKRGRPICCINGQPVSRKLHRWATIRAEAVNRPSVREDQSE